jgi:hypothetical protein
MNDDPIEFEKVREMFRTGELWQKDVSTLNRCLRGLAIRAEENPYIKSPTGVTSQHSTCGLAIQESQPMLC